MPQPVVIEAVRTPFGRKGGGVSRDSARLDPGRRSWPVCVSAKVSPAKIEDVVTGCVSQAGEQGANIGRLAVLLAGFPVEVPAVTLNRMCGSSQQAIHFAAQEIGAGMRILRSAPASSTMTRVPMFSDVGSLDKLNPQLAKFNLIHQGESAERLAEKYKITRRDVDEFSMESHRRAMHRGPRQAEPRDSAHRRSRRRREFRPRSLATRESAIRSTRPRSLRWARFSGRTATAW